MIDKLVGDEVMALYVPQLIGKRWEDEMLRDAGQLLEAVGFGPGAEPWLRLGVGLDVGRAFVGNFGSGEVKDFTALGDVVNTAARLQSSAARHQRSHPKYTSARQILSPSNLRTSVLRNRLRSVLVAS